MGDRDDAVRARAYALWMNSGRPESAAMDFWLEAERQIEAEQPDRRQTGNETRAPERDAGKEGP